MNYLRSDDSGAAARGARAVLHWCNPALAAAFATWQEAAQSQVSDRTNELKASKFLQMALALKALTGFKWAVQEAHVDRAAAGHRGGAVKKAVLRGWCQVTWYLQVWRRNHSHHTQQCAVITVLREHADARMLQTACATTCASCVHAVQEKRQKQLAAAYAWSTKTKHKALTALLSYASFRRTRLQQTVAARHHCAVTRKAGVLAAWRSLARYLAPIRTGLEMITHKVSTPSGMAKSTLFSSSWRRRCAILLRDLSTVCTKVAFLVPYTPVLCAAASPRQQAAAVCCLAPLVPPVKPAADCPGPPQASCAGCLVPGLAAHHNDQTQAPVAAPRKLCDAYGQHVATTVGVVCTAAYRWQAHPAS